MALPLTFPLQLKQSGLVISASPSPRCQASFYVKLVFFLRFLRRGGSDITIRNLNCSFRSPPVYTSLLPSSKQICSFKSLMSVNSERRTAEGIKQTKEVVHTSKGFPSASLGCLEHSVPQGKAYFIPASSCCCAERQTGGALGSVSLHTFTHAKRALLTLLARRQVTLPHCAIPLWSECRSILPFGMQPRWYYKSMLQAG